MYPNASDWKSNAGAAGWLWLIDPADQKKYLIQSQGSTIIRKFQSFGKLVLAKQANDPLLDGFQVFAFDSSGNCFNGSSIDQIAAASRAGAHNVADIAVDGVWTQETADLLGFLLCKSGNAAAARKVAADSVARSFSTETWRLVYWLGNLVDQSDWNWRNTVPVSDAARKRGEGIVIPPGTILPSWGNTSVASSADTQWVGKSVAGDPIPNPPSQGGGTRAWPETTTPGAQPPSAKKSGGFLLWLIAGAVVLMLLSSSGGGGGGGGGRSRGRGRARPRGLPPGGPSRGPSGMVVVKEWRDLPRAKPRPPMRPPPRQLGAPMRQLGAGTVVVASSSSSPARATKSKPRARAAKPKAKTAPKGKTKPHPISDARLREIERGARLDAQREEREREERFQRWKSDPRNRNMVDDAKEYGAQKAHGAAAPDAVSMRMDGLLPYQMRIASESYAKAKAAPKPHAPRARGGFSKAFPQGELGFASGDDKRAADARDYGRRMGAKLTLVDVGEMKRKRFDHRQMVLAERANNTMRLDVMRGNQRSFEKAASEARGYSERIPLEEKAREWERRADELEADLS